MTEKSEIRKHIVGSWRIGSVPSGEGSGMITLTIQSDGGFNWVVTRGGIFSRTMGMITGSDHIIGSWLLDESTLHLYVKKFSAGLKGLTPHALLATAAANVLGTNYGGEITSIDHKSMIMNGTVWERV
ncbi:hypothetical protein [Egbenema bharatensis]|uniref:hypothetical protein n=1 Tax=Egbenema bharatensis TaxID=3463334 RepID=UPI003A8958DA